MAITRKLLGTAVSVLSLTCAAAYADSTSSADPASLAWSHSVWSHSEVVRFNDLNLDQPRDLARLFNRVTSAANKVCGPRSFAGLYNKTADYESCYSESIAHAVSRIDQPSVTAYFRQRSADWAPPKLAER
jgi:UrcA family protein